MESEKSKLIFEAIKKDDDTAFAKIVQSNTDLKIRFGRFPLLSVCYLFESNKILSRFENAMISYGIFTEEEEYFEIYEKFKSQAKKALRLYYDDSSIVYPAEMLAILDKRSSLVANYRKLYKNDIVVANIKRIFSLNSGLDIEISTAYVKLKPN